MAGFRRASNTRVQPECHYAVEAQNGLWDLIIYLALKGLLYPFFGASVCTTKILGLLGYGPCYPTLGDNGSLTPTELYFKTKPQ